MREDLANRTNTLTGAPGILFGRHCLRETSEPLFVIDDPFEELRPKARSWCRGSRSRSLIGDFLGLAGRHKVQSQGCKCKKTKRNTTHHVLLLDTESRRDRKSTRLNSSHLVISYAVFCLK